MGKRTMTVFFVIDTSGSMEGEKMNALNSAFQESIPVIREIQDRHGNVQIKIAVLGYSSGAEWKSGPVDVDKFGWDILSCGGVTDIGAACNMLNEKLSTKGFIEEGCYAPVILVTTDGEPTDDWKTALKQLRQNKWFNAAFKVAYAIGGEADREVLKAFTGNAEAVLDIFNPALLKKIIEMKEPRFDIVPNKTNDDIDAVGKAGDGWVWEKDAIAAAGLKANPNVKDDREDW